MVTLTGLTCQACKKITEKRIGNINGVRSVDVETNSGVATIIADRKISLSEMKEVLKDTPYQVSEIYQT